MTNLLDKNKTSEKLSEIAHLMRRASFGASPSELESLIKIPYEDLVDSLIDFDSSNSIDEFILTRYHPMIDRPSHLGNNHVGLEWLYRMLNTSNPLEEKMALFWHHVFATGNSKVESSIQLNEQIKMFRKHGLGSYRELLKKLARDPAMLYWLDNTENHKKAPNENWGRELLELFSMGAGNYSEEDVYECSRAFTGWTVSPKIHWLLWGPHLWEFEYKPEDHDYGEKTFLGKKGNFNGDDIIDIIVQEPACHRFIIRHLYNFFVADEPQVPAWSIEPPQDQDAIDYLCDIFVKENFEMKPVLRAMLNSEFFKNSKFNKIKSPAEVIVGTFKLTGDMKGPDPRWSYFADQTTFMGQALFDPPSVEGWHTGKEWVNSGSFINRVNFMSDQFKNINSPGIVDIIKRLKNSNIQSASELLDKCLEIVGYFTLNDVSRIEIESEITSRKLLEFNIMDENRFAIDLAEIFSLIAGTREYQFG